MKLKKYNENFEEDFDWDEDEPTEFEATMREQEPLHYISTADLIQFITKNSDMHWNQVCDYVYKKHILSHDGPSYFSRGEFEGDGHSSEVKKWVGGFFKVHPWLNHIMIVFDD